MAGKGYTARGYSSPLTQTGQELKFARNIGGESVSFAETLSRLEAFRTQAEVPQEA